MLVEHCINVIQMFCVCWVVLFSGLICPSERWASVGSFQPCFLGWFVRLQITREIRGKRAVWDQEHWSHNVTMDGDPARPHCVIAVYCPRASRGAPHSVYGWQPFSRDKRSTPTPVCTILSRLLGIYNTFSNILHFCLGIWAFYGVLGRLCAHVG